MKQQFSRHCHQAVRSVIYEKWKINEMNPTIAWITASKEFVSHGGRKRNPEDPLVKEKLLAVQGDQGSLEFPKETAAQRQHSGELQRGPHKFLIINHLFPTVRLIVTDVA